MKVVSRTTSPPTLMWSEKVLTGENEYIDITSDDPAKYIWDDDNGMVFIQLSDKSVRKVQSIDLDYILEQEDDWRVGS